MRLNKKVWIPAALAIVAALLLVSYYIYVDMLRHAGGPAHPRLPEGASRLPGGDRPAFPPGERPDGGLGSLFTTLGTVAVFVGAFSFTWFWFKKKLRSPSLPVRQAAKLMHAMHKLAGWTTLLLIAAHGTYFLIAKTGDSNIYSGLAGFVLLLAIVGYGLFIRKVRSKWMRTIHRSLGLLWCPLLLLHAGGSVLVAALASVALGGLVWLLERTAANDAPAVPGEQ